MAVDYGLQRVGLAISDSHGTLAFPLATLTLRGCGTRGQLLDAIVQKAVQEGAEGVIMGLPLHEDGTDSLTTRQVRNVTARLKRRLLVPVYYMPEYLSSEEALADLREAGLKGKKLLAALDQQAACRILLSFLNQPHDRRRQA